MTSLIWQFFNELAYSGDSPTDPIAYETGDYEGVVFTHGTVREYHLHVPENFDPLANYPLVISIHGYSSSSFQNRYTTRFTEKADEEGFIVVYPEGRPDDQNGQLGWYARPSPHPAFADDITFIRDLIDHLASELPIDPERIFATGLSNGGGMSYRLACEMSDRIAAVAPVAGAFAAGDECNNAQPIDVIAIHGMQDNIVEYEGVEGWSESLPQWAADWATRNKCDPTKTTTTPEDGLTIDAWSGCADDVEVMLYSYAEMRHQWHADATDLIWEFFSRHTLVN